MQTTSAAVTGWEVSMWSSHRVGGQYVEQCEKHVHVLTTVLMGYRAIQPTASCVWHAVRWCTRRGLQLHIALCPAHVLHACYIHVKAASFLQSAMAGAVT